MSSIKELANNTYIETLKETQCNVCHLKDGYKWNITEDELDAIIM